MWVLGTVAEMQINADSNFDFAKSVSNEEIFSKVDAICKSQPDQNVFWAAESDLRKLLDKQPGVVK